MGTSVKKVEVFFLVAAALVVYNMLDGVFTMFWVDTGFAYEANPVMKWFLDRSYVAFMLVKTVFVSGLASVLFRFRNRWSAKVGMVALFVVYSGVLAWHGYGSYLYYTH